MKKETSQPEGLEGMKITPEFLAKLTEKIKSELKEEFNEKFDRLTTAGKDKYKTKTVKIPYKLYRLKQDIMAIEGRKKFNNIPLPTHLKGQEFEQDPNGTKTVGFNIKIGDPQYFEFVGETVRKFEIPILEALRNVWG